jgi:uncharacterized protein (TIGR01777 family)
MQGKRIVIAGGTGLVGRRLKQLLEARGHHVAVLSRGASAEKYFFWDPEKKVIDLPEIADTQVLINLSGAGIADERWTVKRKKVLHDSRVGTNEFLYSQISRMPALEQFVCASGINAYGYQHPERVHVEEDPYGHDYLSLLVKDWEQSARKFESVCKIALVRTAVVLDADGGALKRLLPIVKIGAGSPIGSGKQAMPWIHIDDLCNMYIHVVENGLSGTFNAVSAYCSNRDFLWTLSRVLKRAFYLPNVPAVILKVMFGEMASMLLKGVKASNEKIRSTGFIFNHTSLETAFRDLFRK